MVGLVVALIVLMSAPAAAQSQTPEAPRPLAWDVARAVLIDPTTYAPALISRDAMIRDWKTSQVLFAHGWLERNPRFTVTGLPDDVPISYEAGRRIIRNASWKLLRYSAINNATAGIGERLLIARYPHRRKLIRTLSWAERIAYASILTYRNTADHLRQSKENRRLALEYGYAW